MHVQGSVGMQQYKSFEDHLYNIPVCGSMQLTNEINPSEDQSKFRGFQDTRACLLLKMYFDTQVSYSMSSSGSESDGKLLEEEMASSSSSTTTSTTTTNATSSFAATSSAAAAS